MIKKRINKNSLTKPKTCSNFKSTFQFLHKSRCTHQTTNKSLQSKGNPAIYTTNIVDSRVSMANLQPQKNHIIAPFEVLQPNNRKPQISTHRSRDSQYSRSSICSQGIAKSQTNKKKLGLTFQHPLLTLQEIQQKLQQLIRQKLIKLAKRKPLPFIKEQKSELDQQLQNITQIVKILKNEQENSENIQQCLQFCSKKILMVEKIIAESTTQSQMLKKLYFAKISQKKCPSLINNKNFALYKSASILQKLSQSFSESFHNKDKPQMHYHTNSTLSYKKPSRKDYQLEKIQKKKHEVNRQPLPRTTYDKEFLTYGTLPFYIYKENTPWISRGNSKNISSIYKADFKSPSNPHQMNYKEFDCYKNKFNLTKISFIQACQKKNDIKFIDNKENIRRNSQGLLQNTSNCFLNRTASDLQNTFEKSKYTNNAFFSETRRNFVNKNQGKPSTIKDKFLNSFKNSYKAAARA